MTAPSYTTDLNDLTLCEATTDIAEASATGWTSASGYAADTDYFIQGSYCISVTLKSGIGCYLYNNGSGVTFGADDVFMAWVYNQCPNALANYANGGIRLCIGSALNAFYAWAVLGSDTYQYGGWQCIPVNPAITPDYTAGSPSTTKQYFGVADNQTGSVSKGNPMGFDALRYGRAKSIFAYGDEGNGYCTFAGFAAVNDTQANRWGLIQAIAGGYLFQGLMTLGTSSNAVDFRDSNRSITIANTLKVSAGFNAIEISHASSRIDWTNISFVSLGTVSPGKLTVVDNADVNFNGCSFTAMGIFVFQSNTTLVGCTFRLCGQVTQGGADIDDCIFTNSSATTALLVNNPDNIDNCSFVSDGTGHAIELTDACAGNSYTLTDFYVSGYAASDGDTGNEAIYNNSGGAVTINIDGGSGVANISVRNGSGASTTLVAEFSFTITGLELNTEVTIVTSGTSTVLFNVENATTSDGDGKYQVTYTHSGGGNVDVLIHHVNYKPDISNIIDITLPSSNSSTKVQMFLDENYSNPV